MRISSIRSFSSIKQVSQRFKQYIELTRLETILSGPNTEWKIKALNNLPKAAREKVLLSLTPGTQENTRLGDKIKTFIQEIGCYVSIKEHQTFPILGGVCGDILAQNSSLDKQKIFPSSLSFHLRVQVLQKCSTKLAEALSYGYAGSFESSSARYWEDAHVLWLKFGMETNYFAICRELLKLKSYQEVMDILSVYPDDIQQNIWLLLDKQLSSRPSSIFEEILYTPKSLAFQNEQAVSSLNSPSRKARALQPTQVVTEDGQGQMTQFTIEDDLTEFEQNCRKEKAFRSLAAQQLEQKYTYSLKSGEIKPSFHPEIRYMDWNDMKRHQRAAMRKLQREGKDV